MKNLKELREAVGSLITRNDEIADHVSKGTDNQEMRAEFTDNEGKILEINSQISILSKRAATPVVTDLPNKEEEEIAKNVKMADFYRAAISGRVEGFVAEMHQEGVNEQRDAHIQSLNDGVRVPMKALDVLTRNDKEIQKRATMVAGTNNVGGYAVQTTIMSFIEALWPRLYFSKFGVTPMTGLSGNIAFPRTTTTTAAWKTEVASVTGTNPTLDQVSLTPHRLPSLIEASKTLLSNSQVSDSWLLGQIMKSIISQLEYASIQGTGVAPIPTGILSTSGIGDVAIGTNGGAPTYASILELISDLGTGNANFETGGFLLPPVMMTKLMGTQTFPSSSNGQAVLQFNGTEPITAGYKTAVTTNVPTALTKGTSTDCSAIIFGDFSELMIGQWGGIEMYVDPITKMEQSITRVFVESFWDVAVKHAASFSAIQDARNV